MLYILFLLLNWILFIIVKWHNPTKDLIFFFFVLRLQVLCLPSSCFDSLVFRKCLVHDNERHAKSKQFTLDRLVWCIWTFLTKKCSCVSKILLYEAFVYTLIKRNVSRTQKGVLYSKATHTFLLFKECLSVIDKLNFDYKINCWFLHL